MSAPIVVTIRPGVQFTAPAAASFRRLEADLGRRVDVNSTYRDWNLQLRMYNDWRAYVAGRGPKPNHSRAIHPKYSKHTTGLALDSDDWRAPGFIALAAQHGWIRTAASDPTERHHFEYQWWRDRRRNDPVPAGNPKPQTKPTPTPEPEPEPTLEDIMAFKSIAIGYRPDEKKDAIESTALDWEDGLALELHNTPKAYTESFAEGLTAGGLKILTKGHYEYVLAKFTEHREAIGSRV